jgi:hypothetical protein
MEDKFAIKIMKLLNELDGYGLIMTDDELLKERLNALKYEYFFGE